MRIKERSLLLLLLLLLLLSIRFILDTDSKCIDYEQFLVFGEVPRKICENKWLFYTVKKPVYICS